MRYVKERRNHCEPENKPERKQDFLYKKVYQDLKDRIQNGEYLRDALLPSEREIGETYQVDRTTVRKALQLLVDDGLVEKRAGKGTVVVWRPDQEQTQSRPVLRPERRNGPIASFFQEGITTVPALPSLLFPAVLPCGKGMPEAGVYPGLLHPGRDGSFRRTGAGQWIFRHLLCKQRVPPPSGPGPGVKDSFHTDKQLL